MIVTVDLKTPSVGLREAEDCGRFHVEVGGDDGTASLDDVLSNADVGRVDGDDVLVRIDAVRGMAEGQVTREWAAAFERMIDFAKTKGWVDAGGRSIRAHVERVS